MYRDNPTVKVIVIIFIVIAFIFLIQYNKQQLPQPQQIVHCADGQTEIYNHSKLVFCNGTFINPKHQMEYHYQIYINKNDTN